MSVAGSCAVQCRHYHVTVTRCTAAAIATTAADGDGTTATHHSRLSEQSPASTAPSTAAPAATTAPVSDGNPAEPLTHDSALQLLDAAAAAACDMQQLDAVSRRMTEQGMKPTADHCIAILRVCSIAMNGSWASR